MLYEIKLVLFGFNLMQNFVFPYFSKDIAEFWRRWHISLSTWFRDYVYIPLGGSKGNTLNQVRNIFLIFLISGFWHGANWTFIIWGLLNALYFLPIMLTKRNRKNMDIVAKGKELPSIKEFLMIIMTFPLTTFSWIFFRANNLDHALNYISIIFSRSLFSIPLFPNMTHALTTLLCIFLFILIEWRNRESKYALESYALKWKIFLRYSMYTFLFILIFWFSGKEQ